MKRKKRLLGGIFLGSMVAIGVGFAALSNINLKITGDATVGPNTDKFNVYLEEKKGDNTQNINCSFLNERTITCNINFKENEAGTVYADKSFLLKYEGVEELGAKVYPVITKMKDIDDKFNVYVETGSKFDKNNPIILTGENSEISLSIQISGNDVKVGDKIEFEVKLIAEPIEK